MDKDILLRNILDRQVRWLMINGLFPLSLIKQKTK